MLDAFLEVAYASDARREQEKMAVALLSQLPTSDLTKLAAGQKLSSLGPMGMDGSNSSPSFLDKFKGTPLFDEALALEQEELQAEMTQLEGRKAQRSRQQMESGVWDMQDELRVKKRLLELRLAQEEVMGAGGAGAVAPPPGVLPDAAMGAAAPMEGAPPMPAMDMGKQGSHSPEKIRAAVNKALKDKGAKRLGQSLGRNAISVASHPNQPQSAGRTAHLNSLMEALPASASKKTQRKAERAAYKTMEKHDPALVKGLEKPSKPFPYGKVIGGTAAAAGAAVLARELLKEDKSKHAMSAGEVVKMTSLAKKLPGALPIPGKALGALGSVNKQLGNFSSLTSKVGMADPAFFARVDGWGRELARVDFSKAAEAAAIEQAFSSAGRQLAHSMNKEALGLGGLGGVVGGFIKNPKNLGTVVGAGVGAAGGLAHGLRADEHGNRNLLGGIAEGVGGAALGAGAGHAVQGIGSRWGRQGIVSGLEGQKGLSLGQATKGYAGSVKQKLFGGRGAGAAAAVERRAAKGGAGSAHAAEKALKGEAATAGAVVPAAQTAAPGAVAPAQSTVGTVAPAATIAQPRLVEPMPSNPAPNILGHDEVNRSLQLGATMPAATAPPRSVGSVAPPPMVMQQPVRMPPSPQLLDAGNRFAQAAR